mmetsp:Transcript_6905/g.9558  ORF Transcript_6905/g.9558 Transcript_6905/m.9558 type:complete len:103 (-) Transcript_6905:237-545(-)
MFKTLSPDLSYIPDPPMTKKPNTTTSTTKPTQLSVQRPGQISKEAIKIASKGRLQYKVPKKSDDFAFAYGKNLGANEARTRSAIQLNAKRTEAAASDQKDKS